MLFVVTNLSPHSSATRRSNLGLNTTVKQTRVRHWTEADCLLVYWLVLPAQIGGKKKEKETQNNWIIEEALVHFHLFSHINSCFEICTFYGDSKVPSPDLTPLRTLISMHSVQKTILILTHKYRLHMSTFQTFKRNKIIFNKCSSQVH